MAAVSFQALKQRLAEGVLAFPVTAFDREAEFDPVGYEAHLAELMRHRPAAIFPAGGAGELFSLSLPEHEQVISLAVKQTRGLPVFAGAGQGVAIAIEMARAAERAGADGVLLFPPYLITPEQEGLAAYIRAVCSAVGIAVIAYSRNNGVLSADTAERLAEICPNLIAVKDGTGEFESLVAIRQRLGDRLLLINGVPTAETLAPQCFAIGIRSYTSAVFSFLPELAVRYWQALRTRDQASVDLLLARFYVPLVALRNRKRGYAVALVKAGLRITGRPAGPVRPPLVELSAADEAELAALIEGASDLLADAEAPAAAVAGR